VTLPQLEVTDNLPNRSAQKQSALTVTNLPWGRDTSTVSIARTLLDSI